MSKLGYCVILHPRIGKPYVYIRMMHEHTADKVCTILSPERGEVMPYEDVPKEIHNQGHPVYKNKGVPLL